MNLHEDFLNHLSKVLNDVVPHEHDGKVKLEMGSYEPFKEFIEQFNHILKSYQKPIMIEQEELKKEIGLKLNKLNMQLNAATTGLADETKKRILLSYEVKKYKKFLDDMLSSMPSVFIIIDRKTRVTEWNLAAESFFSLSREEAIDKLLYEVYPQFEICVDGIEAALLSREHKIYSRVNWGKGKEDKFFDINVFPLSKEMNQGAIIQMDDVTNEVKLEGMLKQNEKMQSISGLSAGVAHELNNPIGAIAQNIQNIARRLDKSLPKNKKLLEECGLDASKVDDFLEKQKIPQFIESVISSSKRAADIVDGLLKCSRINSCLESQDLHKILDSSIEIVKSDSCLQKDCNVEKINFIKEYDVNVKNIMCAKGELENAFINILKNSVWFIHKKDENISNGEIIIKTYIENSSVHIEIKDNGTGMNKKQREKIFEPFYTTKDIGQGIGLGMSVTYFIITSTHNGAITVESKEGEYTKILIILSTN